MISLNRAIEGFLLYKRASGRSPHIIRNYRIQLKRLSEWLRDPSLDEVASKDLEAFFVFLQEEYRIRRVGQFEISPRCLSSKTCRNAWGALSVFWSWASKEFGIDNPFEIAPVKNHSKPMQPFSQEEVQHLLRTCEETETGAKRSTLKSDRAIILTLLDTGIRVSELTGADIGDLDLEAGRLLVTGKGSKSRYLLGPLREAFLRVRQGRDRPTALSSLGRPGRSSFPASLTHSKAPRRRVIMKGKRRYSKAARDGYARLFECEGDGRFSTGSARAKRAVRAFILAAGLGGFRSLLWLRGRGFNHQRRLRCALLRVLPSSSSLTPN